MNLLYNSYTARSLLICAVVVQSACILPPSIEAQTQPANQQVSLVSTELEPIPVRVVVANAGDTISFRLVADDADAMDILTVQFFRVADDGKLLTPAFRIGTLTALDPPIDNHPTWRSFRDDGDKICAFFTPAKTVQIAVIVSDRGFNQDGSPVNGATSSRANWVFECP